MSLLGNALGLFILQAAAIIALSRLFGRAAARVGQPLVVAEMVVGIVLGPSLLGLVAPAAADALFPPSSLPALGVVSHVGLMLFMFLVGLKLDPKALRGRARASFLISNTGILVPFALGALAAVLLYPHVPTRGPPAAFALFMGVSMSVTAFPVVARILAERRLLGTKIGAIAVACAAVDDGAAWCLLAFVVAVARADGVSGALLTTLLAGAFVAVALLVVRPLLARAFRRTDESARATPNLIAAVLCLLLLFSWLTESIGIHALFGAFIAGAILPKRGGLTVALSEKLDDIVLVFFLPLFFAYSGLRTHIGLLDTPTEWLLCAGLILLACVGKLGSATLAARLCGLGWRESSAIGVLMNTRGLMELVILNIGLDLEVVSPTVFTLLVIMSLVTTLMTTPLLGLLYPAGALLLPAPSPREPELPRAEAEDFRVLVYLGDVDVPGLAPLTRALVEDDAEGTVALHLGEGGPTGPEGGPLDAFTARAESLGLVVHPVSFPSSDPRADLWALADAKEADLVLVGRDAHGCGALAQGEDGDALAPGTPATVATLVDRGLSGVTRALVVCRTPDEDGAALRLARRLAQHARADVTVLQLVEDGAGGAQTAGLAALGFHPADGAAYQRARPAEGPAVLGGALAAGYDVVVLPASLAPAVREQRPGLDGQAPPSLLLVHDRVSPARARPYADTVDEREAACT